MEENNFISSYNNKNVDNILFIILQEGIKNKISDLINKVPSINDIKDLLNSEKSLSLLFSNLRPTIVENVVIGKSDIDGKDYFINIKENKIISEGYYKIDEIIENNGEIIFQACDEEIDGYYAYYNFKSGKIISKKSDKKFISINNNLFDEEKGGEQY